MKKIIKDLIPEKGIIRRYATRDGYIYKADEADRYISELKAEKAQAEDNAAFWKAKCEELRSHAFNASSKIIDGISEKNSEIEMLKQKLKDLQEYTTEEVIELCVEKENVWQLEKAWDLDKARIKELEAENESLKYSVATLDTDIAMMKRWRKFSEEKPSEEMEGEDFLVSNGYYSVVCEWRGYWNNEPFCGDKNCDVVKFWMPMPPMEEK